MEQSQGQPSQGQEHIEVDGGDEDDEEAAVASTTDPANDRNRGPSRNMQVKLFTSSAKSVIGNSHAPNETQVEAEEVEIEALDVDDLEIQQPSMGELDEFFSEITGLLKITGARLAERCVVFTNYHAQLQVHSFKS